MDMGNLMVFLPKNCGLRKQFFKVSLPKIVNNYWRKLIFKNIFRGENLRFLGPSLPGIENVDF